MASTLQIDRLLETCVRRSASDLHLAVGKPPTLRLHGHMRELQTKVLDAEDTMALMKSVTPERIQQEFEETGSGDFGESTQQRLFSHRQLREYSAILPRHKDTLKHEIPFTLDHDRPITTGLDVTLIPGLRS